MRTVARTALLALSLAAAAPAEAVLVNGLIIPAPANVGAVHNGAPQGFDEVVGRTLALDLAVDGGTVPRGSRVDSHMIFLNPSPHNTINRHGDFFDFDGPILGVMSDIALVVASNAFLGHPGTDYTGADSGMELGSPLFPFGVEGYGVSGSRLGLNLSGRDFIRVVTLSNAPPVPGPEPEALPLALAGLLAAGAWAAVSRRRAS